MDYCAHCKNPSAALRCSACHAVLYCNADHQKADWKTHKPVCQLLRKAVQNGGYEKVVHKEGSGKKPNRGDTVRMKYAGKLPSGKQFDAGDSFEFQLGIGQVIRGWDEGVATMSEGEEATLYITPDYAYGHRGAPGAIPPDAYLIFDVTLLKIL